MNDLEKLKRYEQLYRIAVDDYCSSSLPTKRTTKGLNRMIRYDKKIDKIKKIDKGSKLWYAQTVIMK